VPQFPSIGILWIGLITKVTRINIVKISVICPALFHYFVFEYATQHYGIGITIVIKIVCVGNRRTNTLGKHVYIFIVAVFAEKNPIT
jgi:hypothetical protein